MVTFASNLETIHLVENLFETSENAVEEYCASSMVGATSQLTDEIKILSSEHGRARRYLREIPKECLKAAVKYGRKTKGGKDQMTGLPRWKYTFGNIVYITDHTSEKEVTCYKEPLLIATAPISTDMIERHNHVQRIIKEDPHLCTSHFVVIVDQSGSMKTSDVNGFRNRSQTAYGYLALDCIAEQLSQDDKDMVPGIDTLTLIEMNDTATIIFDMEPLDWILFNKILMRQTGAKPRSHGNYGPAILEAKNVILREQHRLEGIEEEDLPGFALILLSDGKPSDIKGRQRIDGNSVISCLSDGLKDKFTFFGMGIGANGSDFSELKILSSTAESHGSKGEFIHAGLSAANLGDGFSKISSSMSTVRSGLLSTIDFEAEKVDEAKIVVPLKERQSFSKSMVNSWKMSSNVSRWQFNLAAWEDKCENVWYEVKMLNVKKAVGFMMDNVPFGKGRERLAYFFKEMDANGESIGKRLVAKEKKGINDEKKKFDIHELFCRIQVTARELSKAFNKAILKTPLLKPINQYGAIPPKIIFLNSSVYEYMNNDSKRAGILVESYLKGKFTKYNSNNGFVNKKVEKVLGTLELKGGNILRADFLQAFSH